jgi:fluoroacetyl-CoA thioesterase
MKDTLKPGMQHEMTITVDKGRTIDFLGEELRVYATPEFVRDIEVCCLEFLQQHCDEGESSVGIGIEVTHSGATPLGGQVKITATVAEVDGRRVSFEVMGHDGIDEVGRGKHGRFVVAVDQLKQRVAAKVAKMKGA